MELWISLILFVLAVVGIVLLRPRLIKAERKTAYVAAISALAVVAVFMLGYAIITVAFVDSVSNGTPDTVPAEAIVTESGDYYLYGVVSSGGSYYAQVLTEQLEPPTESDYRYIPLADELEAFFQDPAVEGAWSPEQYLRADELAGGCEAGKVLNGARFSCEVEGGFATRLEEYSYYE